MNHRACLLLLLALYTRPVHALSFSKDPLHKITSFFTPRMIEKIDHKELPAASLQSISISNITGPITIKTGWKKDYLCLKTVRRAKKQIILDGIKIIADSTKLHHLAISTHLINDKIKGYVEYELIVPASLNISLKTKNGDLSINDIEGKTHAITTHGNITIVNTKSQVYAQSIAQGTITIADTYGPIEASSELGSIIINNAHNSVIAHSSKGKIDVGYSALPNTGTIRLTTTTGNISLSVPSTINAAINGLTHYGTLYSDHYITLNPYSTKLDNYAWNRFKKEVNGIMGSGDARISLNSIYGNIKILETVTT